MNLKILSLNCWSEGWDYGKRWPLIADDLSELRPDVAGLQEVFTTAKARALKNAGGYPMLAEAPKKSGLVLLSNFKKKFSASLRYEAKSPNESYFRYAFWTQLEIRRKPWDFFVTHLSWRTKESEIRQKQIAQLWQWIEEKNAGKRPCVLMGDMNSVSRSGEMKFLAGSGWLYLSKDGMARVIKAQSPFRDTFPNGGPTWSHKNKYTLREDLPERRIDYIWFRSETGDERNYKIKSSRLCFNKPAGKIYPSDHFGVMTTISW